MTAQIPGEGSEADRRDTERYMQRGVKVMLDSIDRLRARAYGQLIEKYALAGDWARMRVLESRWVVFATRYHGRDRTEICHTEMDARLTARR